MPEVIYQTREDLYPRFGLALPERQQVYVREDLPEYVKRFVISHELGGQGDWTCRYEASDRIHRMCVDEPCAISPEVLWAKDSWKSEVRGDAGGSNSGLSAATASI
jgi:hypothetical protein